MSILGARISPSPRGCSNSCAAGLERVPVIVGGIIPPADTERLKAAGVAAVYTPKDFAINGILGAIVKEVETRFYAALGVRR